MNAADIMQVIKDAVISLTGLFAIFQIWLSLKEYRLKLQAETRLTESTRAETDIRLLETFSRFVNTATGRKDDSETLGKESVETAFASILTLAKRHPVLKEPAREAYNSLRGYKPDLAERYLNLLNSELE